MEQPPIVDLVELIADEQAVEPTELGYELQEYIPVDAIEQLAAHEDASWTLSFELPEQTVTITSDGVILVNGKEKELTV